MERLKRLVNRHLNPKDDESKIVDTFIILLIAANVLSVMLETEPEIAKAYPDRFTQFELFSTAFFTIEYVLRLWVCNYDDRYKDGIKGRVRFAFTLMALVDIIAILPFYLTFFFGSQMDLRIVRAIRLMRLLRILKMGRYAYAVRTVANVFGRKREELAISAFVLVVVLVLCSSVMYFLENTTQPEAFRSIPEAMWWAVITITSVGYGDVSPLTSGGKIAGSFISVIGVLMVALPTGILASGFAEEIREQRGNDDANPFKFCPHCGESLLPADIDD